MKTRLTFGILALVLVGNVCWFFWKRDEPRRAAFHSLEQFAAALQTGDSANLLNEVVLPQAIHGRTAAEQTEFLQKALRDEISADGLQALKRDGVFGTAKDLFPAETVNWAKQAGVRVENCVAFKLERDGLRTEVVLVRDGQNYRIVRCNNVKQLAAAKP